MDKAALLNSDAVAMTWGKAVLGPVVHALPILISLSALGSCNAGIFASSRYCMIGARYGYLPEVFACIQKKRLTPLPGIVFQVSSNLFLLIKYEYFVGNSFNSLLYSK